MAKNRLLSLASSSSDISRRINSCSLRTSSSQHNDTGAVGRRKLSPSVPSFGRASKGWSEYSSNKFTPLPEKFLGAADFRGVNNMAWPEP